MNYTEQSTAAGRHIMPDLTRAFALIGIALVNVAFIAYPMMMGFFDGGLQSGVDKTVFFVTNGFFALKSYTLFSFMFGVGFAYQMRSADKAGKAFAPRYWRRIVGLLVLGLLHVAFLFQGDILIMYAILGSVLFLFRNASFKTLMGWGIGIYGVQVVIVALMVAFVAASNAFAPEDMATAVEEMRVANALAREVYGAGTYAQSIAVRFKEWTGVITFGMLMQGFGAFSFFLFGMAAVKSGVLSNPSAPVWAKFRKLYLPVGITGSLVGAWILFKGDSIMDPAKMVGMFLLVLSAPFSTAGYLGLIAKWAEGPITALKTFMARGGTATLTAYLMQGLLMSLIFNAYGLGLYTKFGAGISIGIALLVALFTIAFASLWRKKFTHGPMEFLLRSWTYLGKR